VKVKEQEIRRQFQDAVKTQQMQYKLHRKCLISKTPKADQKDVIKKLKDDQMRRLAMLAQQYEHSIAEMVEHQNVRTVCAASLFVFVWKSSCVWQAQKLMCTENWVSVCLSLHL